MTEQETREFVAWYEARLDELGYPPEIKAELRKARTKWLKTA